MSWFSWMTLMSQSLYFDYPDVLNLAILAGNGAVS